MASAFTEQLQSELNGIEGEISRLSTKRDLIQQLIANEGGTVAEEAPKPAAKRQAKRQPQRRAAARKPRRPRGMITNKVREYLTAQSEPVHATQILKYLEDNDAAPMSAKPLPTLQSTLQRMKELGEVENTGRNRWQLIKAAAAPAPAPAPAAPAAPLAAPSAPTAPPPGPVVTSERRQFGGQRP